MIPYAELLNEKQLLTTFISEKAYKDKIREWKLVKNLKRRQRVYMLKMERKRREEEGKATTFFHHGNIVPEAKLYRYSKTVITDPTISGKKQLFILPGHC